MTLKHETLKVLLLMVLTICEETTIRRMVLPYMNRDTFSYDSRLIPYHKRSFSSSPSSLIPLRVAKFAAAQGLNSHMKGKVKFQSGWTE